MKRNNRHRSLAYEQLESKAAPSSILVAFSGDQIDTLPAAFASSSIATHALPASYEGYETDQILRFVAENTTGSERAHRTASPPSTEHCAAADEMMRLPPAQGNSLLVFSFYDDGTEL